MTDVGKVTINLLKLNSERQLFERQFWLDLPDNILFDV